MTTHPNTIFLSCDEGARPGAGDPGWEAADAATWRRTALDLLDVDLNRTYLELGCNSTTQYADWELGLLPGYAEELLRIAQKLLDLPEIDRALCAGELSWEQVVVLTRVAVPQHEYAWLDRALELPLEELTQLVERSAEGWAPPVASSRGADALGTEGCETVAALHATSRRTCARVSAGPLEADPRREGRIVAAHAVRARAGRVRCLSIAPNVRQPFHPPSSTS